MQMNAPAPRNALDENRQGLIGKPIDRVDGRLKVMGLAPYAHEVQEGGKPAYGFIVEATIARGSVAAIDTAAAERAAGVLLVMTHKNAPQQAAWGPLHAKDRFARASPQLGSGRIEHYGQAVAFVVAQSFEQARSAARLVKFTTRRRRANTSWRPTSTRRRSPPIPRTKRPTAWSVISSPRSRLPR